jgi:hypothetical protein
VKFFCKKVLHLIDNLPRSCLQIWRIHDFTEGFRVIIMITADINDDIELSNSI